MSNPLTDLFTGGLGALTGNVKGILDKFITDPEKKLEAQLQVETMAHELQLKLVEADKDLAVQQASVIVAETKSESWLARNWRPILMLTFTYIIAHNYVFATLFHLTVVPIPPDMWDLLKLGM